MVVMEYGNFSPIRGSMAYIGKFCCLDKDQRHINQTFCTVNSIDPGLSKINSHKCLSSLSHALWTHSPVEIITRRRFAPAYVARVHAMLADTPDATASLRLNVQFNRIPLTICDVSDIGELFQSLSSNASKAYRLVLYSPLPR